MRAPTDRTKFCFNQQTRRDALPPTVAPRLVAPIPPLAPTATRYGGLALRDIAFGSSQGRLGKGGQGTVWLGRHYGGRLAVKQPLRASSAFASECQIAAALHHENIIYVMGFATQGVWEIC